MRSDCASAEWLQCNNWRVRACVRAPPASTKLLPHLRARAVSISLAAPLRPVASAQRYWIAKIKKAIIDFYSSAAKRRASTTATVAADLKPASVASPSTNRRKVFQRTKTGGAWPGHPRVFTRDSCLCLRVHQAARTHVPWWAIELVVVPPPLRSEQTVPRRANPYSRAEQAVQPRSVRSPPRQQKGRDGRPAFAQSLCRGRRFHLGRAGSKGV